MFSTPDQAVACWFWTYVEHILFAEGDEKLSSRPSEPLKSKKSISMIRTGREKEEEVELCESSHSR
jgi:hypothetical protein